MREIKFRAWTNNLKDGGGMYYQYQNENEYNPLFSPAGYGLLNPTLKIMQCCGVKDKKGKEIYENDIVEYTYIDDKKCSYKTNGLVVWSSEDAMFLINNTPLSTFLLEVIGNIYENPNLLNNN